MPALYAGKRVGKPLLNGHTYNAMFNGKLVWPLDRDTVVSIEITDDKGKPLPKSLAVSGTLKLGAKATYADGHVGDLLTTKNVTFTSRDTSTATVSGNTLTWRHGGTILVTATVNGFTSAAASIASAYAPESIKVTDDSGKTIDNITPCVWARKSTSRCVSCPRKRRRDSPPCPRIRQSPALARRRRRPSPSRRTV